MQQGEKAISQKVSWGGGGGGGRINRGILSIHFSGISWMTQCEGY